MFAQCQLCESLFYCSHAWLEASKACNMSWMELHGTDVVNFSHYWSSIHYLRHRIDDLWVAFACLWQKLYHFTIVISSWRFWPWKCKYLLFLLEVTQFHPRDCMHVWETWMAFDEVTLCSLASAPDQGSIAVQLRLLECFVVHYTSSACWGSEWAEKGSACGLTCTPPIQGKQRYRAYKESCLPIKSRKLFIPVYSIKQCLGLR